MSPQGGVYDHSLEWVLGHLGCQIASQQVSFLDQLGNHHFDLGASTWRRVGEILSSEEGRWWDSWNETIATLTTTVGAPLDEGEGRLRMLLELDPEFYSPCSKVGRESNCLEELLFVDIKPHDLTWIAERIFAKHWPELTVQERRTRFRFWNRVLKETKFFDLGDIGAEEEVDLGLASR